jgi:hypothetical protein
MTSQLGVTRLSLQPFTSKESYLNEVYELDDVNRA